MLWYNIHVTRVFDRGPQNVWCALNAYWAFYKILVISFKLSGPGKPEEYKVRDGFVSLSYLTAKGSASQMSWTYTNLEDLHVSSAPSLWVRPWGCFNPQKKTISHHNNANYATSYLRVFLDSWSDFWIKIKWFRNKKYMTTNDSTWIVNSWLEATVCHHMSTPVGLVPWFRWLIAPLLLFALALLPKWKR